MKYIDAAHPTLTSNQARLGLSVVVTALYMALSLSLYPHTLAQPLIFAIVPVGFAAVMLGIRGGLMAGVAILALNGLLLYLSGAASLREYLAGPGWSEALVALAAGLMTGWLRDTQVQVSRQAVEFRRAQQETAEQRALSEALRDTLSELVATLDLTRVFQLILNNVWRVVPHDAANIMLIEGEMARIVASRGYNDPDVKSARALGFNVHRLGNLRRMLETGRSMAIANVRGDPGWVHDEHDEWISSYVGAPIRMQGKVIGFLNLDGATPGLFTEADGLRLQSFADEAAIAIHNARLYEQIARHAELLEEGVAERTAELRAAKERLEELDRLKSKFVADVSHELRTPVANLSLYVDLLENGPSEKHEEYIEVVGQQVARLSALVESILNLTRLELGRGRTEHTPLDLNRIARESVTAFTPRAGAAGLTLVFEPHDPLPPVLGQASQVGQVIANLLSNAIQYTRSGQVRLSTATDDGRGSVLLRVADTGVGISADDMPHLFERFYRGRNAAESAIPGTGLGLSIVEEIVNLHGGSIRVESSAGGGSTFTVRLPVSKTGGE